MKYDKILIGYDDSKYSVYAVKEAAAWITRHGGEANLVHGVYFNEEEFGIRPEMLRDRMAHGIGSCDRARNIAAEFGITMDAVVKEGDPSDVIVETAVKNDTDLIVLGTYGRKGLGRMIIGSVTAKVIADSPCDVLVVKSACGGCSGRYANILVAYDGSPSSNHALKIACDMAISDGGKVTAHYVIPHYQEMLNFFKTEGISKILIKEAKKILDQAVAIGKEMGVTVDIQLAEGQPAEKLVNSANANGIDLVVMGSYGWHGINKTIIGSTAERVIMLAERPVLVAR